MAPPKRFDPYTVFKFRLEIDSIASALFSECSGLSSEVEVIEYRTGAGTGSVRKLPGLRKFANIVLKRGITKDRELWDWYKTVLDGNVQRKSIAIVLQDDAGQDVLRWVVREGWPRKYEGPALNASGNEVAIETLEIAHEGFELA